MPKLTSIKRCHVCGSISLIPFYKVPISDLMTDEDIYRDVLFCTECETAHYINDYGRIEYTNPNLFITRELCEQFWKEEPKLIKESGETGFEIDVSQPYERIVEETRVYLKQQNYENYTRILQ